jgi:hypothetical protein
MMKSAWHLGEARDSLDTARKALARAAKMFGDTLQLQMEYDCMELVKEVDELRFQAGVVMRHWQTEAERPSGGEK